MREKPLVLASILLCSQTAALADGVTEWDYSPIRVQPVFESSWQVAASDMAKTSGKSNPTDEPAAEYKTRWFTSNKVHQYLGIGSIALAGLTVIAPKPDEDDPEDGVHHALGEGAAVLGGLAVATGLGFHYEDLKLNRGFKDPDNLHALLATLGTIGFFAAVDEAPEGGHAGLGVVSGLAMLTAIKITW